MSINQSTGEATAIRVDTGNQVRDAIQSGLAPAKAGTWDAFREIGKWWSQLTIFGSSPVSEYGTVRAKSLLFARTPAAHMENPARWVPVEVLAKTINTTPGLVDPRGSAAVMHYTRYMVNDEVYNLEVLYDKASPQSFTLSMLESLWGGCPLCRSQEVERF